MLGLGLGVDKSRGGFGKFQYLSRLPSFVPSAYSLAFDASGAETLADYEAGTLYFRDSNFNRVGATFSRTTTATRVNKQGLIETVAANVPRIDYTDGSAKLLMEPSRTNLILISDDFTISPEWVAIDSTVIVDSVLAPDGGNSNLITATADGNVDANIVPSVVSGATYVISCFFKKGISSVAMIRCQSIPLTAGVATFDLDTLVINKGSWPEAGYEDYGNGWFRFYVKDTAVSSGAVRVRFGLSGLTGETIYAWGAQLEAGNYPTSYIPTAGSTVTRNADDISQGGLSANIPDTGAYYHELSVLDASPSMYLGISDNTINNRVVIGTNNLSIAIRALVSASGSDIANIINLSYTISDNVQYKAAVRYKTDDFAFYFNGNQVGTDTLGTMAGNNLDTIRNGNGGGGSPTYGRIDKIIILNELTNAELAQLTS